MAGLTSAAAVRALGADAAYARLLQTGTPPHFIGYYVLVMGLQDRPWNDCRGDEKNALRARFDAIKAEIAEEPGSYDSHIEQILNKIGTGRRR